MIVILWAVKINYVHTVVALLDVGIVPYLTFVITATAAKLFALIVFIVEDSGGGECDGCGSE